MRTTEQALDITIGGGGPSVASRLRRVTGVLKAVLRRMRNRSEITMLQDLDDYQLRDIGLCRQDVDRALTSSFFDSPGQHLTRAARNRANRLYDTPYV